ncbi:MAG: alpha/beta hydrolase [Allosphingosinicella sp.]
MTTIRNLDWADVTSRDGAFAHRFIRGWSMLQLIQLLAELTLTVAAPTQAAGDTRKSPYPPIRLNETPPQGCGFNRIMVGPSGSEIAVWGNERGHLLATRTPPPFAELAVGRMHDKGSAEVDRFLMYNGPDLTIPVRWASGGRVLYARATRDRIVTIDADSSRVEEQGLLDAAWKFVDIRATTHGDLSALEEPDLLAQAKRVGADFYRGHATLGERVTFIGARTGDLELVRIDRGRSSAPVLRASYTRWILGFPDDRDYTGGVAYVGAEGKDKARFLPYQRPLVDLATGQVVGKYNGTEILLRRESALTPPLAQLRRKLASGGVILDASFSGGTLVVLTQSGRGDVGVSRLNARGFTEKSLCSIWLRLATTPAGMPLAPDDNVRIRIFGIDAEGRESFAPGLPIAILHQAGPSRGRDALISFNGGPTASLADRYMSSKLRMLAPERDLIAIDYSGSVGGGSSLTRRLTDRGLKAIDEDVEAVVKWLDRQGYHRIFLEGNSFGGVPATIALARYPSRFAAAFMSVPLLRLKDPWEWTDRGDLHRTDPTGQRAFEEAIFGGAAGRTRFAADLSTLVAQAPYRPTDRFIFSRGDPTSQPGDLPAGHKARVRITGGPHGAVASHDAYFEEVIAVMEQAPASASALQAPRARSGQR